MTRHHPARLAVAALVAGLFAATAATAAFVAGASPARADDAHLDVAAPWHVDGVDPAVSGEALLRLAIAETLVDADAEGRLRPGLATDWSVSEDGLAWRFVLREGVVFHDGSPLDAAAAAAAVSRAAGKPGPLSKAPVKSVSAGDGTVEIELSEPFAALPALLAHASTVILAPAAFDAEGGLTAPIGTGPFAATEIVPPQSLSAARFADYWGPAPALETVRYLSASRAETRALLAESGDAGLVFTLDPAGFRRVAATPGVEARAVAIPRVTLLKVNAGHPFLAEPEARRALSLAIQREGIAAGILRFPDSAATQLFPPVLEGWHRDGLEPHRHDPEAARALLADLGWTPGPDGILTRDGERFELTVRTFPDRPELPLIAAALQDQWRDIGVALEISVGNFSEIPAGHQDGSLELALYARNYGLTPDPIGTILQDFGAGGGDWGAMNWTRPEVAEAVRAIAADAAPGPRAERIETVARALHEDLPVIPIVWYQHTAAVNEGLEGVTIDPLERDYGLRTIRWAR